MKEKLISKDMVSGLHPVFRGRRGERITNIIFKLGGINKINAVYDSSKHLNGVVFINDVLDKQKIIRKYENIEVLDNFKEEPFIIVSNHPYGHLDGLIEISGIASVRRDYKMLVNWILMQIDTLEDHFIGVNPYPKDSKMADAKSSVGGLKQCLEHLRNGHPLGLFPAGGISLPSLRKNVIDRDWQEAPLKLIKKAKVPVIPVFISGCNSLFYQLLGYIGWQVRSAYLLHEFTNKKGKTIHVKFGDPISVAEQSEFTDINDFGKFLKSRTYALKTV